MIRLKVRPHRLLLVTFDLTGTMPGDKRYDQADAALSMHGPVFKPVKQQRLLITRSTSKRVKASLDQRIGKQTTIFIAPIASIPAWRIDGIAKRREWRAFVKALEDNDVVVSYLSDDAESAS